METLCTCLGTLLIGAYPPLYLGLERGRMGEQSAGLSLLEGIAGPDVAATGLLRPGPLFAFLESKKSRAYLGMDGKQAGICCCAAAAGRCTMESAP